MRVRFQTKILALVLAGVALPVLLMGGYLLQRNQEVLTQKVRETLSNHLFQVSTRLDDWMQQRLHEVSRWSASFVVFEGVESLSRPGLQGEAVRRDLKGYLESVLGHYRNYESLFILDLQGRILASTRQEQWEAWGQRLIETGGLARGGMVSPLHRSEFLGRPTMLVLHTIQGRHDRNLGYFVERVDLRELESLLSPISGDPVHSFWLLDQRGRVLVKAGKVPDAPGQETFPGSRPETGPEGGPVMEANVPGVGPAIYAVRRLKGPSGGYVVATVSAPAAYRPLLEARNRLLGVGLPLVALVVLAAFLVARGMLRPILRLSEAARDVSAGELNISLPVTGDDEMADLTRAFNEMAHRVREGQQNLQELAMRDGLTGLFNRRHFEETLDKELRRCEREGRTSSLLMLDLDRFKEYNDRWGHTEGDAELKRVASQIMQAIRSSDMAFRYGGEELAVFLHSCTKQQAAQVAEKIRQAVAGPLKGAGERRTATVSIGVSTFPEDGQVPRSLVDAADAALYLAKAQGRDRVALATGKAGVVPEAAAPARPGRAKDAQPATRN